MNNENKIIIYQDDDEITHVSVRFADEDLWLTQNQLAEIYCTTQQNISQHVDNIYKDGELSIETTNKKFLLVRQEGNRQVRRNIDHYNLDMIIALGYRVQSQVATRFRRWATQRLHEYIQKGFAMDDERLKQGGNRYFRELLQRIRDIRSSERNFYQQVTEQSLFGEIARQQKRDNTISRIAQLYLDLLGKEFAYVIKEPLVLRNSTNCPIFHFVFASHNRTGVKIASEIVGKKAGKK